MKKLLALLLTVAMLVSVVYVMPITASAQEVEVPTDAPVEIQTDFGVDEVDDSIPGEDEDSGNETVLYAEIERYVGDTSGDKNIMENVSEKYEASFASALSSYIDVDDFKEYVIDAFDTCTTSQVNISSYRIPTSKWNDLCDLIFYDIPELFQVQTLSGSYSGSYLTAIQVKQYPTYCDTASEYTSLMNRVTTVANQLLAGIKNNSNLTNLQKMILLHDRIATYCEYDPNQLSNGEYRDQDYTMTGVFVDKVAVCQGYACAYNYLLKQVGIESYQCRSTALCHAWNLVKVGSYYYHVDITWDDTGSPLDLKGRVYHENFLRSNTGIRNTGHTAYDYDTPTNNSTYDSYFWQNSDAEFVLVGNTIYYYDSTCGDLKTYSGTVKSNQSTWTYGRILADGNYIYITTSSSVLRYDTTTNTTSTVYTPSLSSGHEIYGLYKDGSYIYCTSGSTSTSTQTRHQVTSNPTPPSPSPNTLLANNSYSASITSGGQVKTYSFTPTTSGNYVIYSTGSDDTRVYLCNSSGSEITSDDDGGDGTNFRLQYNLTAGTTYQFKVRYYNSSKTGTINFKFGNVFTVSYNANGGSGAPATQYKDYGKSITLSSTTPTRSGSTFRGWGTSSSSTTASYQPGSTYSTEANITLYAVWSGSGGTLSVNTSYSPSISANSYKEYTFTPSSSGKYVIYSTCNVDTKVTLYNSSGSAIDSDDDGGDDRNFRLAYDLTAGQTYRYRVEFYSSSNSGTLSFTFGRVYTVTYNANGGSGAPATQYKDYGKSITLSSTTPTRSGSTFRGWGTSSSSTTASYQPGATYTANADLALYAVWTSNVFGGELSVNTSYSPSISTNSYKEYTFTPSSSAKYVIYSTCNVDTKVTLYNSSGSVIDSDDDGGDEQNFRLAYNLTAGQTYRYKVEFYSSSNSGTLSFTFGRVYTVTYNANGGSGAPSSQEKDYGRTLTLSTQEPVRPGYNFEGWGTSSSSATVSYRPGATYTSNANITLYAVWTSNVFGGQLSVNTSYSPNIATGTYKEYTFTPSSSGKYVIYSTCDEDTKVTLYNSSGSEIDSDDDDGDDANFRLAYNLTAGQTYRYKIEFYNSSNSGTLSFTFGRVYTVTYNANGGNNAPSSQEKDYGRTLILSTQEPVYPRYDFEGWATDSSSTTVSYRPGDRYTANANITLYAVWSGGDVDYYKLELNETYSVTIESGYVRAQFTPTKTAKYVIHSNYISDTSNSQDTKVWLYDENGNLIASDDDSGEGLNFQLIYELQAGRTYIFELSFYNQSHGGYFEFVFGETYSVTYNANGGKSAPKAGVKGYQAPMTISTWKPTRSGYIFLGWATSKKATTATYKRGGTYHANINYNITLYAVWKKGSLGATAVLKGKLLDYNTIKVFWRAVPGADGYKVYYKKASAKSYMYAGIVAGTSYTNDFTAGTKYNFKVIPCMQNNNGTYTNGKAKTLTYLTGRLLNAPSWLTATLYGYDDVQLKWGKVPYATKYKIYYRKNNASSYTYKGMTSSTSYKMANLTDGALYNFAILPCMSVNGSYLDAAYYRWVETYTLKKVPTPSVYYYTSTRVQIYWDNILGESGYQISKSTSKNGTNVIYTGTVSSYDSPGGYYYKDISAPRGKTYYYKVRAYTVQNGKKIYGPWSTAVKYRMS